MDSCDGVTFAIEFLTREPSPQLHLYTLWKGEVIEEAGDIDRPIKSELLQCGKQSPFMGGIPGWLEYGERNLDELE